MAEVNKPIKRIKSAESRKSKHQFVFIELTTGVHKGEKKRVGKELADTLVKLKRGKILSEDKKSNADQ